MKMISLLSLCLVLLGAVCVHGDLSWKTEEATVTLGPEIQSYQLHCKVSMPDATGAYDVIPNWYKAQRMEFVEEQIKNNVDFTTYSSELQLVSIVTGLKGVFNDEQQFGVEALPTDENANDGTKELDLVLTLKDVSAEDSGYYICEIDYEGKIYMLVHEVRVLTEEKLTVKLSGIMDNNDLSTNLGESGSMLYYESSGRYGSVMCTACDGSSPPIVKIMVGDEELTGLEEVNKTTIRMGDIKGLQTMQRCITKENRQFQPTKAHSGHPIKCKAMVMDDQGGEVEGLTNEVTRDIQVYFRAEKLANDEGCAVEQQMPLGREGRIICKYQANPAADSIIWKDDIIGQVGNSYTEEMGDGYTTQVTPDGDSIIATLIFDEVTEDHYHNYMLVINNEAGQNTFMFSVTQGESTQPGQNVSGGASSITVTLTLLVSLLLCLVSSLL